MVIVFGWGLMAEGDPCGICEAARYGRLVAEVFIKHPKPSQPDEELLLNDELVRAGMAYHYG